MKYPFGKPSGRRRQQAGGTPPLYRSRYRLGLCQLIGRCLRSNMGSGVEGHPDTNALGSFSHCHGELLINRAFDKTRVMPANRTVRSIGRRSGLRQSVRAPSRRRRRRCKGTCHRTQRCTSLECRGHSHDLRRRAVLTRERDLVDVGMSRQGGADYCPEPGTTLTTPGGKPASSTSFASSSALEGVRLAGLRTMVFPAASAGPSFQQVNNIGEFQGSIAPTTPTGSRRCVRRAHRTERAPEPLESCLRPQRRR